MPCQDATFVWRRAPDQRATTRFFERYAVLPQDAGNLKSLRALESAAGMTVVGAHLDAFHPTAKPAAPDQEGDTK